MGPPLKLFKNQKYQDLKQECIKDGRLFCDPTFLPENDSLFYNRLLPGKVVWKRPQVTLSFVGWLVGLLFTFCLLLNLFHHHSARCTVSLTQPTTCKALVQHMLCICASDSSLRNLEFQSYLVT